MDSAPDRPSEAKYRGVILGAALGDALGWPHENRARNASGAPRGVLTFQGWVKRSGGRFQPHEEQILPGSYSDDTQLIIAVARSRIQQHYWWDYFSRVELPLWTVYEKGGGGATLRAAKSWLKGVPPWQASPTDARKYFNAGGNGAAMRIAPHVLVGARKPFSQVARDIAADSIITHGHPHGIVGALSYGYALWFALRNLRTLEYGQLIKEVLKNRNAWAQLPDFEDIWPGWRQIAMDHQFEANWNTTIDAQIEQLEIALESLEAGALSVEQETLEAIGCFDKKILGAGTVAASAAIYLASRYATGPMEGVAAAAFSKGADTDTLASMTGALAGAISGSDWLGSLVREVQDYDFLLDISAMLQDIAPADDPFKPVGQRFIGDLYRFLDGHGSIDVPTGFPKTARAVEMVRSKSDNLRTRSWVLDGRREQTLFIKKLEKPRSQDRQITEQSVFRFENLTDRSHQAEFAGIGLFAGDLDKSTAFYGNLLGLPVVRETPRLTRLGSHLVLRQSDGSVVAGTGTVVYIQVPDLRACLRQFSNWHLSVPDVEQNRNRLSFICHDPDGRTVEVFERRT
ncbi:ADP-ribosylglycohydrolase family protein [Shinella sp. PSBB067]|uniref:ADP-ribosylglycohydrolase family protein n=1 Tax=Shinella sp. PSBB067 TaxID=2715959 RepID=UPI00193C079E|nr:ADP-ribosylglycohydrolase family protein [Shinella sp. PSBB067]QRI63778.1 ADP-ribosylglycohydrolase family protein [Shinella sp. PSBB067]